MGLSVAKKFVVHPVWLEGFGECVGEGCHVSEESALVAW